MVVDCMIHSVAEVESWQSRTELGHRRALHRAASNRGGTAKRALSRGGGFSYDVRYEAGLCTSSDMVASTRFETTLDVDGEPMFIRLVGSPLNSVTRPECSNWSRREDNCSRIGSESWSLKRQIRCTQRLEVVRRRSAAGAEGTAGSMERSAAKRNCASGVRTNALLCESSVFRNQLRFSLATSPATRCFH